MSTTHASHQSHDATEPVQDSGALACPLGSRQALSRLSHELRTPLNAVLGFTQLLRSLPPGQLDTDVARAYVEHIERSGWRLLEFINVLLDPASAPACPLQQALRRPDATGASCSTT
jgi:nitrogen-specific signal transduction histidine kinase